MNPLYMHTAIIMGRAYIRTLLQQDSILSSHTLLAPCDELSHPKEPQCTPGRFEFLFFADFYILGFSYLVSSSPTFFCAGIKSFDSAEKTRMKPGLFKLFKLFKFQSFKLCKVTSSLVSHLEVGKAKQENQ